MGETFFKKSDLSEIFNNALKQSPEQKAYLQDLWKKIKAVEIGEVDYKAAMEQKKANGDDVAAFCYEYAAYVYFLLTEEAYTEEYWNNAVQTFTELSKKYGEETIAGQWVAITLLNADDLCSGRWKLRGQHKGRLNDGTRAIQKAD